MKNKYFLGFIMAIGFASMFILPADAHNVSNYCRAHPKAKKCKHSHNHSHNNSAPKHKSSLPPSVSSPINSDGSARDLSSCHANELSHLIGQNKNVLATMRFSMPIRVEEPGMMVTMEYSAQRLRIMTDRNGTIRDLMCG